MGNYISCTPSSAAREAQPRGPRVILPGGGIRHLGAATATAAELMLDHPGHFLVHASAVLVGRRLSALSADEELEIGAVYAMFPMGRIGSVATAADLERQKVLASGKAVALWAAGQGRRVQGIPVFDDMPAMTEGSPERRSKLEVGDEVLMAELTYSKSMCRSRRPALQTITEEVAF